MKSALKITKIKSDREKYIPFAKISKKLMRDPKFRAAQKDLELEFQIMDLLIDRRIRQNITQKELAKRMGTKQSVISRIESGGSNISIKYLKKLAEALDAKLVITIS